MTDSAKLKPVARDIIHELKQTPINIKALEQVLRSYPFPPRRGEHFAAAMGTIMATEGRLDAEIQLRLQILELVYRKTIN